MRPYSSARSLSFALSRGGCVSSSATRSSAISRSRWASADRPIDWDGSMTVASFVQRSSGPSSVSRVSLVQGSGPSRRSVEGGERLARARRPVLQRAVEPEEPELFVMLLVVRAHPAHELAVGRGRAEAVAEAASHDVVERVRARRDVVVHHEAHEAVALDGEAR